MTQTSIEDKLRTVLSGDIDSECKVLYVLAESRKLLEKYPPDPVPFALKLYCHWALHLDLRNVIHTRPFLERVDEYVGILLSGKNNVPVEYNMHRELALLGTFREEFKKFLQAYKLPTAICDENTQWHNFLTHYAGIIEDGSLECKASDDKLKLKHIESVKFRKGQPTQGSYLPFNLSWEIHLLQGDPITVDVEAGEYIDGIEGVSHLIKIPKRLVKVV